MRKFLFFAALLIFQQSFAQSIEPVKDTTVAKETAKPAILWKYKTNGPVVASPVTDGGLVYVGSLDSTLHAIDLNTGKGVWKLPTSGPLRSSVCISPERLYQLSTDGVLYRVTKDSGQVDGFFQTSSGYMGDHQNDFSDFFTSAPIIIDSVIYFGCGKRIYAVSIRSGLIRWIFKTDGPVHTRPVYLNGWLYAGSFDGNLYCLNALSGTLLWKFKTTGNHAFPDGEIAGNPVAAAGMIIFGARDYSLYAVDVRTGTCNWHRQFPYGWSLPVTVNDSVLYVGTSDDRTLFALDIRTGAEVWKRKTGFNVLGGVAVNGLSGYFGTLAGKIIALDLTNGTPIWYTDLDSYSANYSNWMKDGGAFRDDIGKIIRTPLDMIRMYEDLGGVFCTPSLVEDKLIVAGYDGWVYCLSTEVK